MELLGDYAVLADPDDAAHEEAQPGDAADGPGGGSEAGRYLTALRLMSVSSDIGAAAAVARHCLPTGSSLWPERAGDGAAHPLVVESAEPTGRDGVLVDLRVPEHLRSHFRWQAGQHVSVQVSLGGIDLWRSYSICAPTRHLEEHGRLRIAVRRMEGGLVSPLIKRTGKPCSPRCFAKA